jgi:hypothetical protein
LYDELEDALAALDVAHEAIHATRLAVHKALAAASYPHLRVKELAESEKATLAATGVA